MATSDPDGRLWPALLAHLRTAHPAICRQWFEDIEPLGIAGGVMRLRTHSPVHRRYLERQCADAFNDAVRTVTGRLISVRFLGPDDRGDEEALREAGAAEARANGLPAPRPDALVINPDYTFETFVIGPNNRLAHAAAVAVTDRPGHVYNPLFIHGGVGLGKTHLLQAVCLRILERAPSTVLHYTSCDGFISQYMEAVQAGQMADFRHRFRDVDVLIIDDIHFLAKRDRSQEEFFHTFNSLHTSTRHIVLSSDAPPEEIPHLEERLVSRFKWGMVANISPPDYETRVQILKSKADLRGVELPDDVAGYIATRIDTNIRELEGAITKLQILASVEGRDIDMAMAHTALGETPSRASAEPTIQAITAAVTDFYSVRLADLQSKRRHRSVALPRQVCMYLVRSHTRHSLEEIGGFFGGRDHTTVMHALRAIELRRKQDPEFEAVIRSFEERLKQPNKP